MAYNPVAGFYSNAGLFSPIPAGGTVRPPYQVASLGPTNFPTYEPAEIPGKKRSLAEIGKTLDAIERRDPAAIEALDRSRYGQALEGALNWDPTISRPFNEQPSRERPRSPLEKLRDIENRFDAPSSKNVPVDTLRSRPNPFDEIIHQEPAVTYSEPLFAPGVWGGKPAGEYEFREDPATPTTREVADAYYGGGIPGPTFSPTGAQTAPNADPMSRAYAQDRYDAIAREVAAREFSAMTQYGIDAPRTAATPSSAYTKSELDAITQAEQRDALALAEAEKSKSFMEKLGFTQPTAAEQKPAFHWLDQNAYFDPTGAGAYNIAKGRSSLINTDPLSLALYATGAAPGIPSSFGPLSALFMGGTELLAEERAVSRARDRYQLDPNRNYERSFEPSPREGIAAGIGQFFGFGTKSLYDKEEVVNPEFAGYLGDIGAETGALSRQRPEYSGLTPGYKGTSGYAPGERAMDRYTYHYEQAMEEYNRNMTQAMQMPESPTRTDLISYYASTHPNYREQEFDEKAFQDSAWERGKWDFTLDPITYASGESTVGWTDPDDLNDPNKGLVDPVTGLMYTAALDRMNPDFDKLLDVNERINSGRIAREEAREEKLEKNQREALKQMEKTGSEAPWDIEAAKAAKEAQIAHAKVQDEMFDLGWETGNVETETETESWGHGDWGW